MKKIIIFAILMFCVLLSATDWYNTAYSSWTYKLMIVEDVTTSGLTATWMDFVMLKDATATPVRIKNTAFGLTTTNRLYLYDNNYIYASGANTLNLTGGATIRLDYTDLELSTEVTVNSDGDLATSGDIECVDLASSGAATFTGAGTGVAVTNNQTIGGTLQVSGVSAFQGAITGSAGYLGSVGSAGSRSAGYFSTATANDAVTLTGAGTALDVDNNVNIDGTIVVDLTSLLSGVVTAPAGVVADLTGDVAGNITGTTFTDSGSGGVAVDGVLLIDGDIDLDIGDKLILDTDDDSYLYASADDIIDIWASDGKVATVSAQKLSLNTSCVLLADDITEFTGDNGTTIEGITIEKKASIISLQPSSGLYVAIKDNDVDGGSSHSFASANDLFVEGKLEVDELVYFDGGVSVTSGQTLTVYDVDLGGATPVLEAMAVDGATGNPLSVKGGNATTTGGDLNLDGGNATNDGDVVVGENYGNLEVQSLITFPTYKELTCDGGEIADDITKIVSYITATAADTINVADGVEGQIKSYVMLVNASAFSITIAPASSGFGSALILNDMDEAATIIFHGTKWYVKSKNN